ncbi:hypothetical protein DPMN_022567 [Dreissena polymorpha]|uniref:Uncharacterized protein n=1 Tax=Dreissena polymorpha TaxID=45954 RepID=A0A9D4NQD2_DREPO|nr:hypothetical protein DPMN_022567 [Dreissena polymorpha]
MREQTSQILRSFYKQKCMELDEESHKRAIIETTSRLIKSAIKSEAITLTNPCLINDNLARVSSIISSDKYLDKTGYIIMKTDRQTDIHTDRQTGKTYIHNKYIK